MAHKADLIRLRLFQGGNTYHTNVGSTSQISTDELSHLAQCERSFAVVFRRCLRVYDESRRFSPVP